MAAHLHYLNYHQTKEDFLPTPASSWKETEVQHTVYGNIPCLLDTKTGKSYFDESKNSLRFQCFVLALATPVVHLFSSLVNVAIRILLLVTFIHFYMPRPEKYSSFKERGKEYGENLLKIIFTPLGYLGLEAAAIYGIFSPYNGRKLYSSIEEAFLFQFSLHHNFRPINLVN